MARAFADNSVVQVSSHVTCEPLVDAVAASTECLHNVLLSIDSLLSYICLSSIDMCIAIMCTCHGFPFIHHV